jgi:hypothetical protein
MRQTVTVCIWGQNEGCQITGESTLRKVGVRGGSEWPQASRVPLSSLMMMITPTATLTETFNFPYTARGPQR